MAEHDAADFDEWYGAMAASATRDTLLNAGLGLPPGVTTSGFLTDLGLAEVSATLALSPDEVLLDLACGRGALGLHVAGQAGATLVGVDFAMAALWLAQDAAEATLPGRAHFVAGTFPHIGLKDATVDAAMCIDSIQFAAPVVDTLAECRRVLRTGGRLVMTSWQQAGMDGAALPERIRRLDLQRDLARAGFVDVEVTSKDDWLARERRCWTGLAASPSPEFDPALHALLEEARSLVRMAPSLTRVLATATAP